MQLEKRVAALENALRCADEHVPRALRCATWNPSQTPLVSSMPLAPQLGGQAPAYSPSLFTPQLGGAPLLSSGTFAPSPTHPMSCGSGDSVCPDEEDEDPLDEEQTRETERLLRTLLLSQPVSPDDT